MVNPNKSPNDEQARFAFGESVREYRKKAGITRQAALAEMVGVYEKTVQNWETGKFYPEEDKLKKLIEVLLGRSAFTAGQEMQQARDLWQQAGNKVGPFDEEWFNTLLQNRQEVSLVASNAFQTPPTPDLVQKGWPSPADASTDVPTPPTVPFTELPTAPAKPRRRGFVLAGIIALLIIVVAGLGWFLFLKPEDKPLPPLALVKSFTTGHSLAINSVAYNPDATLLYTASGDETVKVWSTVAGRLQTEQPLRILAKHSGYVYALALSGNHRVLASTGQDQKINIWQLPENGIPSSDPAQTFNNDTKDAWSIALSPDGQWLAVPGANAKIHLWNLTTGQESDLQGHTKDILEVRFSPDGKLLASASQDGTAKLWDVASQKEVRTLVGHTANVSSVAFSPNGKFIATCSHDMTIKIWDLATGKELFTLKGHTDRVYALAWSRDSNLLASGARKGQVILWNATTGQQIAQTSATSVEDIQSLAFSADGKTLVAGTEMPDHALLFWQVNV